MKSKLVMMTKAWMEVFIIVGAGTMFLTMFLSYILIVLFGILQNVRYFVPPL